MKNIADRYSLTNHCEIELIQFIHTKSFITVLNKFKVLTDYNLINLDDALKYLILLLDNALEQSSEEKDFLTTLRNDLIENNKSLPHLGEVFNNKLIYLNGNYSYFKIILIEYLHLIFLNLF